MVFSGFFFAQVLTIGGLPPIPREPKDNGVAAMLDERTFFLSSYMVAIPLSFWYSRDWLQATYRPSINLRTPMAEMGILLKAVRIKTQHIYQTVHTNDTSEKNNFGVAF